MTAKHPPIVICEVQLTMVSFLKLRDMLRSGKVHGRADVHDMCSDYPGKPVLRHLNAQERKLWAYFHPEDEKIIQMDVRFKEGPVSQPATLDELRDAYPPKVKS